MHAWPDSRRRGCSRCLRRFAADPLAKHVLEVGMPFEQGHAVHAGLTSQGDESRSQAAHTLPTLRNCVGRLRGNAGGVDLRFWLVAK